MTSTAPIRSGLSSTRIRLDDEQLKAYLREAGDQWPFAAAIALNRTGEDAIAAFRNLMPHSFTIRRPDFILPPRQLPREWQATKRDLSVIIAIGDGGPKKMGDRRRAILEPFERGGMRRGKVTYPLAIPTTALRPTPNVVPPAGLYPKALLGTFNSDGQFQGLSRKAAARKRRKGGSTGRYFILGQPGDRFWGVYQRTGRRDILQLWAFRLQVRLPARLGWNRTVQQAINERFHPNMAGAIDLAFRTKK
jgi:hypothetical protein